MDVIIQVGYLIGSIVLGLTIYYWSATFKKLASMSMEEFNEGDEKDEDKVNERESRILNKFGSFVFILIGGIVWALMGITIGRVALLVSPDSFIRFFVYIIVYFLFLRFPFGVGNKMVKRSFDFKSFPEKIIFSLIMIVSYILSICCFYKLPGFLKFHLHFLN